VGQMIEEVFLEDHESLAALLDDLKIALEKPDLLRAFELLDRFWARLAVHIRAENVCLFPAILNAPAKLFVAENGLPEIEEARAAIAQLRGDHNFFMDELAQAVKTMRELLSAEQHENEHEQMENVRQKICAVASRLEVHNKLEEEKVYRWPRIALTPPELARLNDAVRFEIRNLPARLLQTS
jgi:iron-sulfur cluster repair protein YtfE (RIC family)